MARLTPDQKEQILQRWRAGDTQGSLAKKFGISKSTVNAICKGVDQDNAEITNAQIKINHHLMMKPNAEANAILEIVDEKTQLIKFFKDSAVRNQQIANKIIEESGDDLNMMMVESHSRITKNNKETALGKQPDTAIQINNTNNPQEIIIK
jgi:DNA-binding XRE family transcriptional regulator